ncbi:MAG TPA: FAD-dependent monooxygenase [Solirubrobacterales bacterium]|nr:FAD-dependent monooxygenase [Solirubrobacterales bacterium]
MAERSEHDHAVAIAGGGPTGLMLAAELALAGVDVVVLERRPSQEIVGSRAGGLHPRTIEILDQRGVADRFLAAGETAQAAMFGLTVLDIGDFPTRHPYALALWQNHIERIMAEWVLELDVPIRYGSEVAGFVQDDEGVDVELADGGRLRARYLVGCDGGRSLIRREAGIDFPGWDASTSTLIAEVEMADEPQYGSRHTPHGISGLQPMSDDGPVRVIISEGELGPAGEPTLEELKEALVSVYGIDYGVHGPIWISRFTDATRQAATYRKDRVLLAGDAAHIHYPTGGQGVQNGVYDAVNLGWKLAEVINGTSSVDLLDTYEKERHPVTAASLRHTMAQTALLRPDPRSEALRETIAPLLEMDEPRRHLAAIVSGLDIRYDLGGEHPLVGRRMPDLDLTTADGPTRVYELMHEARPLELDLSDHDGPLELPVIGEVPVPDAVRVRPDGYVAWAAADG